MKIILKLILITSAAAFAIWLIASLPMCHDAVPAGSVLHSGSFTLEPGIITAQGEIEIIRNEATEFPLTKHSYAPDQDMIGTLYLGDKAFAVRDNVAAQTLKNNVGWLNNSSLPPDGGPCVLMGHRNTQFRVLKDVEIGQQIIFEKPGGEQYHYEVTQVDILESDAALHFYASEDSSLVLVTCYPFYYTGHAPQKYVVTAAID